MHTSDEVISSLWKAVYYFFPGLCVAYVVLWVSVIEGVKVCGVRVKQDAGTRLTAINSRPTLTKRVEKFVFFGTH